MQRQLDDDALRLARQQLETRLSREEMDVLSRQDSGCVGVGVVDLGSGVSMVLSIVEVLGRGCGLGVGVG